MQSLFRQTFFSFIDLRARDFSVKIDAAHSDSRCGVSVIEIRIKNMYALIDRTHLF